MTTPTPDAAAVLVPRELIERAARAVYFPDDCDATDALADELRAALRAAPPAGPAVDAEGYERGTGKLRKALAHADGHHSIGLTKRECSAILAALAGHVPQGEPVAWMVTYPDGATAFLREAAPAAMFDAMEAKVTPLYAATPQEPR